MSTTQQHHSPGRRSKGGNARINIAIIIGVAVSAFVFSNVAPATV